MKHYLDITLLPDSEVTLGFIWQKVYQQVHIALVDNKVAENESAIAIAFPNYADKAYPLGNKLRLLVKEEQRLKQLNIQHWLKRFEDYVHISSIKAVPEPIDKYASFSRNQFTTNSERLARRRAKRHGESYEQALQHYEGFDDEQSTLPFINVRSLTKDKQFKLFIEHKIARTMKEGKFNCYGLGKTIATVPCF